MSDVRTLDVSALPPGAFGSRTVTFWGTLGIVVIESTVFALAIGAYFYLVSRFPAWPPHGVARSRVALGHAQHAHPAWKSGSQRTGATGRRARRIFGRVRIWMVVCLVFAVAFNVVRAYEFAHLNVMWDHDAYGSIVWLLLGLHTTHIVTDFLDSSVLTVLMFTGPVEEHRFVDVEENAVYWYFVVLAWLPIYGVIYWAPRLL